MTRCKQFRSTNLDTVHNYMASLFCDHDLIAEGGSPPLNFQHNHARLNDVTFHATDYGLPFGRVVVDLPEIDKICVVQLSITGTATFRTAGRDIELPPGHMCVLHSKIPEQQVFEHDYRHVSVRLPIDKIEAVLRKELGVNEVGLELPLTPIKLEGPAAAFACLVRAICDDIDSGASTYRHARVSEAVEETLKRLLLTAAPHNYSELYNAPPRGPAPYYVRRAEQYIHRHLIDDGAVTLADLIEASGVSARSLHTGFRRFRGTTPMAYLKQCRLHMARKMLLAGSRDGATVTEIAFSCGFSHLSKFAYDYRQCFGELPSETLRQMHGPIDTDRFRIVAAP